MSAAVATNLIERLKELQGNLTDQDFADKLEIHRVSWQRIKNRRVPISDKFLVRIHRAFPELNIFLTEDVAEVNKTVADVNHNASETLQDGKLAVFSERVKGFILRVKRIFRPNKAITDTTTKVSRRSVVKN